MNRHNQEIAHMQSTSQILTDAEFQQFRSTFQPRLSGIVDLMKHRYVGIYFRNLTFTYVQTVASNGLFTHVFMVNYDYTLK